MESKMHKLGFYCCPVGELSYLEKKLTFQIKPDLFNAIFNIDLVLKFLHNINIG